MTDEAQSAEDIGLPGGSFQLFVQKLGYQALLGLGVLENPLTGARETNTSQARMVLDDLEMLRDRTAGNLSEDEDRHLDEVIANLEARFVELKTKTEA